MGSGGRRSGLDGRDTRCADRARICPTSNLLTKALADEEAVRDTFRSFVEHGVDFTIATDGPEMMRTHLKDELELLLRIGALDEDQLAQGQSAWASGQLLERVPRTREMSA